MMYCARCFVFFAALVESSALPEISLPSHAKSLASVDPVEDALGHYRPCSVGGSVGCGGDESLLLFLDASDAHKHKGLIERRLGRQGRSLGVLFKGLSPMIAADVLPANLPMRPNTHTEYVLIQPLFHPSRGEVGVGVVQLGVAGVIPERIARDENGNVYQLANGTTKTEHQNERSRFLAELQKHLACDGNMRSCWSLYNADPDDGMIPSEKGACYSYQFLKAQMSETYDTDSLTNVNWYTYAVADPSTKKLDSLHVYAIAHGLHKTKPSVDYGDAKGLAVGWYKAGSTVKLQAKPVSGDASAMSWVYSHPPTQNTKHQSGHTDSNTNSYTESISLGFQGEDATGGVSFSATQSHTSSYSVSTVISDWSVVEQSDGVQGYGQWEYDETWPVDNTEYPGSEFASNWNNWYSSTSNGCQAKEPPANSVQSQQTSSSIMWRADKSLVDGDGKMLINLDFNMEITPYRLWCPVCCNSDVCNPCSQDTSGCSSGFNWGSQHHCLEHLKSPLSYGHSWQLDAMALLNMHRKNDDFSSKAVVV